jgi:hypothetical protein
MLLDPDSDPHSKNMDPDIILFARNSFTVHVLSSFFVKIIPSLGQRCGSRMIFFGSGFGSYFHVVSDPESVSDPI